MITNQSKQEGKSQEHKATVAFACPDESEPYNNFDFSKYNSNSTSPLRKLLKECDSVESFEIAAIIEYGFQLKDKSISFTFRQHLPSASDAEIGILFDKVLPCYLELSKESYANYALVDFNNYLGNEHLIEIKKLVPP